MSDASTGPAPVARGEQPQKTYGTAKSLLPFASELAKEKGCVCRPLGPTNRHCPVHDKEECP
jgi:hypothetical protein